MEQLHPVLEVYLEYHKHHNVEMKELDTPTCQDGWQWAWLMFGECLIGSVHYAGYLIGALSLPFWMIGTLMLYTHVFTVSLHCLCTLLLVTLLVDVVSFIGAVLSMQVMLLISIEVLITTVKLVLILVVVLLMLRRRFCGGYVYGRVYDLQEDPVVSGSTKHDFFRMTSCRLCCLPLFVVVTSLLAVLFVTVMGTNGLQDRTRDSPFSVEFNQLVTLTTIGYVLGCLACFGQWGVEIMCLRFASKTLEETSPNWSWKGGGVMLMMSDMLYIVGVLLQSGGVKVTVVALPWLVARALQAFFQVFKFKSTQWAKLCMLTNDDMDDNDDKKDDNDNIIDLEVVNLLGSSDSEASDIHVLWDRSWQLPGKPKVHVHYDEPPPRRHSRQTTVQKPHVSVTQQDATSTTDSDWSSTSQEQELLWEHFHQTPRHTPTTDVSSRAQRLSLSSHIAKLDNTSSDTSDQRVRSWISQSTPEEETPSSLTFTLNLDTSQDFEDDFEGNSVNRKPNGGVLPSSPRKNSY